MPLFKDKTRRIYVAALILSFLLISGSIYLHIRQKHHLGRLSFNLDRDIDLVKPTSGVEYTTQIASTDGDSDYNYEIEKFDRTEEQNDGESKIVKLTHECLHCLCMTVNECHTTYCSPDVACGLYRISKFYWTDGGKQILGINDYYEDGEENEEYQEYLTCVNDKYCSIDTIEHYMKRYERDCNKDGIIDCRDYIALHLLGPNGCMTQNVSLTHSMRMNKCLKM